jgi:hypothetical protein
MLAREVPPMSRSIFVHIVSAGVLVLALAGSISAQSSSPFKIEGTLNDYTDASNATAGPWHITAEWSAELRGRSGHVDFLASLTMVRSQSGASSHTHHVSLSDATVTPIAGGHRISGDVVVTTNGTVGFSGSHLDVDITGGTTLPLSNIKLTFTGPAAGHFGEGPIEGVVSLQR